MLLNEQGDATANITQPTLIMHVCNCEGGWGRGFVLALSKKWPDTEHGYRAWAKPGYKGKYGDNASFALGEVQFVEVEKGVWVANMIAQTLEGKKRELNYEALYQCLEKARDFSVKNNLDVRCPMLGAGLSGGDWHIIKAMLESIFDSVDVNCTWYKF